MGRGAVMNRLRIAARVIAGLLLLATGTTAIEVLSIGESLARSPRGSASVDGSGDELAQVAASCARASTDGPFGAEQRQALTRACHAYATTTPESRPALRVEVARASDALSSAYASEPTTLVMTLMLLIFGSLLSTLGIGSVGAVLAVVGTIAALASPNLAAPMMGLGLATLLVALACVHWGSTDLTRRPRDATAALIIASSLVPVAALGVLVAGWSEESDRWERRVAVTGVVALVGWMVAGGPTLALCWRADRLVVEHPQVGGKARIALARLAVAFMGIATVVGIAHAFLPLS